METVSKICTKCKFVKSITDFHKDKHAKDGYSFKCKECMKQKLKDYIKKIKHTIIVYSKFILTH